MIPEDFPTSTPEQDMQATHNYREQLQERAIRDKTNSYGLLANSNLLEFFAKNFSNELKVSLHASLPHLSEQKIEELICEIAESRFNNTIYDGQIGQAIVERLAVDVEKEAKKLGFKLRSGVSYGVDYVSESSVQISPTPGYPTTSVLLVTAGFIDFCYVAARLLARTFPVVINNNLICVSHSSSDVAQKLIDFPPLQVAWRSWFIGSQDNELFDLPLAPEQVPSYITLLAAMESFAIAHEYGHHIDAQSLNGVATADGVTAEASFSDELKADLIALKISMSLFQNQQNMYGRFGLGAVLLLVLRDIGARAKSLVLNGNLGPISDGKHPPIKQRVDALISETRKCLTPEEVGDYEILVSNVIDSLTLLQEIFLTSIEKKEGAAAKLSLGFDKPTETGFKK